MAQTTLGGTIGDNLKNSMG
jgi:parallel beta-helix repeat protein